MLDLGYVCQWLLFNHVQYLTNSIFQTRNVVKAYYTAGVIYDTLLSFGELSEEATDQRKYAKYKAAYIHTCLKNGETPVPGPPNEANPDDDNNLNVAGPSNPGNDDAPAFPSPPPENQDDASPTDQNNASPIDFQPHPTEINGKWTIHILVRNIFSISIKWIKWIIL